MDLRRHDLRLPGSWVPVPPAGSQGAHPAGANWLESVAGFSVDLTAGETAVAAPASFPFPSQGWHEIPYGHFPLHENNAVPPPQNFPMFFTGENPISGVEQSATQLLLNGKVMLNSDLLHGTAHSRLVAFGPLSPPFAPVTPEKNKVAQDGRLGRSGGGPADGREAAEPAPEPPSRPPDFLSKGKGPITLCFDRGVSEFLPVEPSSRPKEAEATGAAEKQGVDLEQTPPQKPRRKKHRPKVVREGKPPRTPKPATPKPATPAAEGTGKRRYVRRKGVDSPLETPPSGAAGDSVQLDGRREAASSAKRRLEFPPEGDGGGAESLPGQDTGNGGSNATNSQEQEPDVGSSAQKDGLVVNPPNDQVLDVYLNSLEIPSLQLQPSRRELIRGNLKKLARMKDRDKFQSQYQEQVGCQLTFGGGPAPAAGSEFDKASNHGKINGIDESYRNEIQKKRRTERAWNGLAVNDLVSQANCEKTLEFEKLQALEGKQGFCSIEKGQSQITPKMLSNAAKVMPQEPDLDVSILGKKYGGSVPSLQSSSKQKNLQNFRENSAHGSEKLHPLDMIIRGMNSLDINGRASSFPQEETALVPYSSNGAIVTYEGRLHPLKKVRPKVILDEETSRMWNLLMGKESNGVEGTEGDKKKWWEEERRVFRGRADSFIAKMHLVQGDRRFSPWKGSVLDSVIGVFLTQNVSDHLSSSAFMSMAARFPPRSRGNQVDRSSPAEEQARSSAHLEVTDTCLDHQGCAQSPIVLDQKEQLQVKGSACSTAGVEDLPHLPPVAADDANLIEAEEIKALGDVDSSKASAVSSQNSSDDPRLKIDHCSSSSDSNSEVECTIMNGNRCSLGSKISFTELLELAGSRNFCELYIFGNGKSTDAEGFCAPATEESIEGGLCSSPFSSGTSVPIGMKTSSAGCGSSVYGSGVPDHQTSIVTSQGSSLSGESQASMGSLAAQTFPPYLPLKEIPDAARCSAAVEGGKGAAAEGMTADPTDEVSNHGKESMVSEGGGQRKKRGRPEVEKVKPLDWDGLRRDACRSGGRKERSSDTMDSLDWEAVKRANVDEISSTIRERGMNNMLAERIKGFLDRLEKDHGSIDLEWLRDVPPDKAKDFLLSIKGLGLKSVECVRLLTLHHLAFPVDTNVGRICVRLGWVPLQPLPESLQLHLLELYPMLETIQKYLWPRLCTLDQRTLYELHYQMITFGKVFCTKSRPNCNACPMRGECKHFASAFASARLALPGPEERRLATSSMEHNHAPLANPYPLPQLDGIPLRREEGARNNCEPIVEEPDSPEPECTQIPDIEDGFYEDPDEIPVIKLNIEEFSQNLQDYMQQNNSTELQDVDFSKALVMINQETASIPVPKLKNVSRLRTEHRVYELPDSHPLLEGLDQREAQDPCPYLLAIWTPGETAQSVEPPESCCSAQSTGKLCDQTTCFSCNSMREAQSQTVRGTLLIPCRTAMRGSFPLNGTYFQVNEVFADHESSLIPIDVPRSLIWNLPRRTVYFGTSIPTIFRGLAIQEIQNCFWRGFVCVRGFDRKTRGPRPLMARLHFPASKVTRDKRTAGTDKE